MDQNSSKVCLNRDVMMAGSHSDKIHGGGCSDKRTTRNRKWAGYCTLLTLECAYVTSTLPQFCSQPSFCSLRGKRRRHTPYALNISQMMPLIEPLKGSSTLVTNLAHAVVQFKRQNTSSRHLRPLRRLMNADGIALRWRVPLSSRPPSVCLCERALPYLLHPSFPSPLPALPVPGIGVIQLVPI